MNPIPTLSILALGHPRVGRRSLLKRFSKGTFTPDRSPNTGIEIAYKTTQVNGETLKIKIVSISGIHMSDNIDEGTLNCMRGAILIYDITDSSTLSSFAKWIAELQHYKKRFIPIIIIGNKCDMERPDNEDFAEEIGEAHNITVFKTSAKTGEGVDEAFNAIINWIFAKNKNVVNEIKKETVILREEDEVQATCSML
ncbi:hypothetical protein SteCoe_3099 [Stentor coeruleus]|uniref:Tr-type G domain-containing protein n=1 Tax=Stentor coeruleus TaxID=5963 RepID=A0A1R2CY63_9CILI|nr:hypothetical protein SteCoe_3099 [Stentor coeruleus]